VNQLIPSRVSLSGSLQRVVHPVSGELRLFPAATSRCKW
jgi:hypothetical protein